MGDDAPARGKFFAGEILSRSNEVSKSVDLRLALAVLVPAIAPALSLAHMGDAVDEAAIDEAKRVGRKIRQGSTYHKHHNHRAGAVLSRRAAFPCGRVRTPEPSRRPLPAPSCGASAAGWIVTARNLLRLAQGAPARLHVVERGERSSPRWVWHPYGRSTWSPCRSLVGVMLQSRAVNTIAQKWDLAHQGRRGQDAPRTWHSGLPSAASVANDPHARSQNHYLPGRKSSASRSLNHTSFLS